MSGNGDIHVPDQETTFLKNIIGNATRRKKGEGRKTKAIRAKSSSTTREGCDHSPCDRPSLENQYLFTQLPTAIF